jgi:5-methylcytosine-specific restriction endonuclease McrA
MPKALLLNHNYQVLQFIPEQRAIRLLLKEKVEVLSEWQESFYYLKCKMSYPAVLRLRYHVKRPAKELTFSRYSVFRRDAYSCQYCGSGLTLQEITLDHVVPRTAGGKTTFLNCVASCYPCNNKKGGRTPEQAEMPLLRKPFIPTLNHVHGIDNQQLWHESWQFYLQNS